MKGLCNHAILTARTAMLIVDIGGKGGDKPSRKAVNETAAATHLSPIWIGDCVTIT